MKETTPELVWPVLDLYEYLNKKGLCDQIVEWDFHCFTFYHWNLKMSELVPTLSIVHGRITEVFYPRRIMPVVFRRINWEITGALDRTTQKFVKSGV